MKMSEELNIFNDEELRPKVKRPKLKGGSQNPIVFHDYDSYIAKFVDHPKTTDDTFTPRDVYEAVVKYVGEVYPLEGKELLRPFYPGGDFENAEYPEDGVVIDNPPFSIFTHCCKWFSARRIPFFLFGPGLTIMSAFNYSTVIVISNQITFDNGAEVKCNFASNLFGDVGAMTAPRLDELLEACPSQNTKVKLPIYIKPEEVVSVSDLQTISKGGIDFSLRRSECEKIRKLDNFPNDKKAGLFGDHLLTTEAKAEAKAEAIAKAKAKARQTIVIPLSERERRIVEKLRHRS